MITPFSSIAIVTGVGLCIQQELEATPESGGVPAKMRVVYAAPGNIAWDGCTCGQLALSVVRDYPTRVFPQDASEEPMIGGCGAHALATRVIVSLTRCAPAMDKNGNPPTPDALLAASLVLAADAYVVRNAVECCLHDYKRQRRIYKFTVGSADRVGPEGGCVGVEMPFTFEEL